MLSRSNYLYAKQRGFMLGEAQSTATRSVFEYLSEKDRERLKNIAATGKTQPSASASTPAASSPSTSATITIPRTEPHIAQAALRGFQPFTSDPTKQARYTAYLLSQAQQDSSAPQIKPAPGQPIDQFNKELEDYAKAALLFKPMSGAMAGRFTSAAVIEHGPKIKEGLHTPSQEELAEKEQQEAQQAREAEEKISPKAHAAKMGMYGPLTREVVSWQPARLLCKRFGVKDPNPPPDVEAAAPPKAGPSSAAFAQSSNTHASASSKDETAPAQQDGGPRKLENIGLGEDETQGQDTLTYQRPAMDIFKAIFASDSEDSDEEDEVEEKEDEKGDEKEACAVVPEPSTALLITNGEESVAPTTVPVTDDGPVDMSTFKPTFIPREGKSKERDEKAKEKKEKKKKEKKGVLVSFEMDESGPTIVPQKPLKDKDRPKKKKRKEKEKREDENEDEGMWVEKAAPLVVKELQVPPLSSSVPPLPPSDGNSASQEHAPRGRKRAIDFM
jgi:G patch domain-containing protein 1